MTSIYVKSYDPKIFNGICFVAQAPGKNEVLRGIPLVGASGQLLEQECNRVGIVFDQCWRGNVIGFKAPDNDFTYFCDMKKDLSKTYNLSPMRSGQGPRYLKEEYLPELDRLRNEITKRKPNLIVALGNEALSALTGLTGITKYRGTLMESTLIPGVKVLPTFHPASVFRQYQNKLYLSLDLFKAHEEYKFPDIRIEPRKIHLYPDSYTELWDWYRDEVNKIDKYLEDILVSVDIETRHAGKDVIVECIGFAFNNRSALVVPFWSDIREDNNYWPSQIDEEEAWKFVEYILKKHPILGQNYMTYDSWVLYHEMGLRSTNPTEDTMIQHHAFQPEMKKGLGLLSSIYCNVPAYKTMKPKGKKIDKRDE